MIRSAQPSRLSRHCLCLLLAAAAMLASCAGGCAPAENGPADSFGVDFSLPADAQKRGAIVFIVDGVSGETFQQMLDRGELPAMKKYFVDRGTYAPRAAANLPAVTLANLTSIATGRFPGHHTVVGVNWFDRNTLVWRDYNTIGQKNALDDDYIAPTIYESFPDELTFSLFYQPHRGTTKFFENWTSAGPPFFFGWYETVDRLSLCRLQTVAQIARQYNRFPAITMVYLLAPDFRAYGFGASSPQYRQALRHTDRQIGRVLGDLQRAGLLDKITIAFVSDHSMNDVRTHFDINHYLKHDLLLPLGSTHWWENDPFEERLEDMDKVAAMPYGCGDRYWALCLRRPHREGDKIRYDNWLVRPTNSDLRNYPTVKGDRNLPAELVSNAAIDAVAYVEAPNRIRVARKCGEVEFAQSAQGEQISYRVISGDDPLGYRSHVPNDVLAGRATLSPRRWLEVTAGTNYPDLPAQILAYFRAVRRAGDLAIFAAPGYDFRTVNSAGHGGLRPEDMFVPLLIAGPGIPHQRLPYARTVDLVPTILTLLGKPLPPAMDGESLVPPPTSQPTTTPAK